MIFNILPSKQLCTYYSPNLNHTMFSDFSFTFLNPNSFEYLDIHCPTEVMAVGTIIFLVRIQEHFFPILSLISWKCKSISDRFDVLNKNSKRKLRNFPCQNRGSNLRPPSENWTLWQYVLWSFQVGVENQKEFCIRINIGTIHLRRRQNIQFKNWTDHQLF